MSSSSSTLIFFPGLGADERLFLAQRSAFPDMMIPAWIPPNKREGLPEYARRLSESLPHDKPLVLGGVSLGGMIAYELARHVRPRAVVLIATCRERRGLRLLYRAARPLWPLLPSRVFSLAKLAAKPVMRFFGEGSPDQKQMLVAMFREMDESFMHWAVSALLRWHPEPLEDIPVFHIHGRRDLMIPARRVRPDRWIDDGGHLINVTHAEVINGFIQETLEQIQKSEFSIGKQFVKKWRGVLKDADIGDWKDRKADERLRKHS